MSPRLYDVGNLPTLCAVNPDMSGACKIECVVRSPDGGASQFAGSDGEGRPWRLARGELIRVIEAGSMTCYVTLHGHSHLVTVETGAAGDKRLMTFLGDVETLPLPPCR